MKSINFILIVILFYCFESKNKLTKHRLKHHLKQKLQLRLKVKSPGFSSLSPGQIIDNKFALHERLKYFNRETQTQLWKGISTEGDNQVVLIKLYDDFKEDGEDGEEDASQQEPRILRREDILEFGDLMVNFEKTQELKIEKEYTDESYTTLVKCLTPERPPAPKKPKPSQNDNISEEEIQYQNYMRIPLYNVFENPKGVSIYNLCKEIQCKEHLRDVAKGILEFLKIINRPEIGLHFSNIQQDNIFYDQSTSKIQLVNMINNELEKEIMKFKGEDHTIDKSIEHRENDIRDLGMTLIWMMVKDQTKDTAFIKDVKNSLELFRNINKQKTLEKYLDVNLGVDKQFTLEKENENMKNLEESFYDFVMKMVGKKFNKENEHDPFESLDSALEHPFLAKEIPLEERPSDI